MSLTWLYASPREQPRSRGDDDQGTLTEVFAGGTAPLTRGRQALDLAREFPDRNSPAHAGTTRRPCPRWPVPAVQPRSRGDDRAKAL